MMGGTRGSVNQTQTEDEVTFSPELEVHAPIKK